MRHGFYVPNFGSFGDVRVLADLAADAEDAGWDGLFLWDHLQVVEPAVDVWMAMTAMALRTERLRMGPLVTPLPRRHIAELARQALTLDELSGGRLVLGLGAGYPHLPDFSAFGDDRDLRTRAAVLDEGLEVLDRLLRGEAVTHHGPHFSVDCPAFATSPDRPRVPLWVAASWPAQRPVRRAARWDGVVPVQLFDLEIGQADLEGLVSTVRQIRGEDRPFDVTRFGRTAGPSDTAAVEAAAKAGATWWIEFTAMGEGTVDDARERLRLGPPRC
ncbi:LLM class flavin-dependent oxidoreductase [Trujillonella endophytica]|uniref:Luciferase-like monooxygenase n=1 Tax=Trujillonella endophytica TaxID=673521 RepID=A0A1H8TY09_9ACTN|nr:LLM class flavin-dependent oxidoreductase [Trujillella endophytica]SEO95791.1 Luciferase-like monooxygenase [Trujillella endophytica]